MTQLNELLKNECKLLPLVGNRMKDLLHLFRWQDGLDILILTYIFYRLYLWLRKKKALRMILAILALPLFYILARWIDLPLSVWGLQNLWPVILIVVVVIFQEEIREVLGNVSLPSIFYGRSEKLTSEAIDKIVDAAFQMADRRIGGLIVFQKGDDLDELIHEKTDLDAEIHEDLLVSIFSPQSPLHDGAVVVQGDRIRHAAALLPLCRSASLPKEWGTRHRAGVGITEISDAECLIISEERGEILLACKGDLQKKERREDLRQALVEVAPVQEKKNVEKRWPKKLLEDLPRKALFLLLVCLLWVFVIGLRQGEVGLNIPIEYYSVPQNLAITGEPPKEVNVRLKGSQRILLSLKPDQIRVRVDLSTAHKGSNQISLSEANIDAGPGISVSNYYPRNIRLQLSPVLPVDRTQ